MTTEEERAFLGLSADVSDAAVEVAYAAYLASATVPTVVAGPTPADLRARYPAFAEVDDATISYWLADAARFVDDSWPIEGDRAPAMIAKAADSMVKAEIPGIEGSDVATLARSGITDFKSGTFSARIADAAVQQAVAGGSEATPYGQDYLALLQRNKGGVRVTGGGTVLGCGGFNGFAGPLGYPAALFG